MAAADFRLALLAEDSIVASAASMAVGSTPADFEVVDSTAALVAADSMEVEAVSTAAQAFRSTLIDLRIPVRSIHLAGLMGTHFIAEAHTVAAAAVVTNPAIAD